jgi:hypothetical protein
MVFPPRDDPRKGENPPQRALSGSDRRIGTPDSGETALRPARKGQERTSGENGPWTLFPATLARHAPCGVRDRQRGHAEVRSGASPRKGEPEVTPRAPRWRENPYPPLEPLTRPEFFTAESPMKPPVRLL